MTNRYWSLALAALTMVAVPMQAQQTLELPESFQIEEKEFAEAMQDIEADPYDVTSIERFLRRHPASSHAAEAQLAYERAQLITQGSYTTLLSAAPLQLHQIKPSRQYLQSFYEGQQLLNDFAKGEKISIADLKTRYQMLAASQDDNYMREAQYYAGFCAYAQGDFEEAESYFAKLGNDSKYQPSIDYYRMQMAYVQGRTEQAMALAQELRQLESMGKLSAEQVSELTRIEAECLMAQGLNSQALEKVEKYLDTCDEKHVVPVSAYNAAVLAKKAGNYALIQKALPQAIKTTDPAALQQTYFLLGQSHLDQKEYSKARLAFSQAANISNGDAQVEEAAAYNVLSCVHQTTQSPWGDEVKMLEQFLNMYPKSAYSDRVSAYLTETYQTTNNYEDALASINRIQNPTATIIRAKQRLLTQQGLMAFVNAGYREAIEAFDQSTAMGIKDRKSYEQAYYWRAESYYKLQNYEAAAQNILGFNELKTSDKELQALAYYTFAYTRMQQGYWDKAITNFERYANVPGQRGTNRYCDAMFRLGECYYYKRQFQTAESYYRDAAQSTADVNFAARALYQIAILRGVQKRYDDKQKALDEIVNTYPSSDWADDADLEKGRNYALQFKYAAAIEAFQHVIDHYPESECARKALLEMAMAYNNIGKHDLAISAYKRVIEQYPGGEEAQTAASDLKAIYLERNDVNGYADYAEKHNLDDRMSVDERDSLNLVAANHILDEGDSHTAMQRYKELVMTTNNDGIRRTILPTLIILAYNEKDYVQVIQCYKQMQALGGFSNTELTEAQLLAAHSMINQGSSEAGLELLTTAAADIRTEAGAEAKYELAQYQYDRSQYDAAEATINDMLDRGTPHRYWLQRAVVLLSDVLTQKGDELTAQEYLKQLQQTDNVPQDIQSLISTRLKK